MTNRYPAYESRKTSNATYKTAVTADVSRQTATIPSTESAYTTATNVVKEKALDLINRLSPDNPYSGKSFNVSNTSALNPALPVAGVGYGGYVTKQGVFKTYSTANIAGTNDCPLIYNIPLLSNETGNNYKYAKSLKQGTPIEGGQTCGNEGSSVYTSKLITNPTKEYVGCYNDKFNALNKNNLGINAPSDGSGSLINNIASKTTFGTKTLDECNQYASENNYQYFAMQKNTDSTYKCTAFNSTNTNDYNRFNDAMENTVITSDVVFSTIDSTAIILRILNTGQLQIYNSSVIGDIKVLAPVTPQSACTNSGNIGIVSGNFTCSTNQGFTNMFDSTLFEGLTNMFDSTLIEGFNFKKTISKAVSSPVKTIAAVKPAAVIASIPFVSKNLATSLISTNYEKDANDAAKKASASLTTAQNDQKTVEDIYKTTNPNSSLFIYKTAASNAVTNATTYSASASNDAKSTSSTNNISEKINHLNNTLKNATNAANAANAVKKALDDITRESAIIKADKAAADKAAADKEKADKAAADKAKAEAAAAATSSTFSRKSEFSRQSETTPTSTSSTRPTDYRNVVETKLRSMCANKPNCVINLTDSFFDITRSCDTNDRYLSYSYKCGSSDTTGVLNVKNPTTTSTTIDCSSYINTNCTFFLFLNEDNGKIELYKGAPTAILNNPSSSSPWPYGTHIWQSNNIKPTTIIPNTNWVSNKGKYGTNFLSQSNTLANNDWIGSKNGNFRLIMQNGVLKIETLRYSPGCDSNTNMPLREEINSIYKIKEYSTSNINNFNKLAYIDSDSKLRDYDSTAIKMSNDYTSYVNYDTAASNNISTSYSKPSANDCKKECDDNVVCTGYVYDSKVSGSNQNCLLKTGTATSIFQNKVFSDVTATSQKTLYIRKPKVKPEILPNCDKNIVDIDAVKYLKYSKINGNITSEKTSYENIDCNMVKELDAPYTAVDSVSNTMSTISDNIRNSVNSIIGNYSDPTNSLNSNMNQMTGNTPKMDSDLATYDDNVQNIGRLAGFQNLYSGNKYIEGMQNLTQNLMINDINGMLSDSDTRILQANYSYIMWSVLAVGLLSITVNTINK